MTTDDENALRSFERKILRRIHGPVQGQDGWRIRYNQELSELIGRSGEIHKNAKAKVVGAPREDATISDAQKNVERETTLQEKKRKT
jgi:hypothetical protein